MAVNPIITPPSDLKVPSSNLSWTHSENWSGEGVHYFCQSPRLFPINYNQKPALLQTVLAVQVGTMSNGFYSTATMDT